MTNSASSSSNERDIEIPAGAKLVEFTGTKPLNYALVVEVMYDIEPAARLLALSKPALMRFLQRHDDEFPARYRLIYVSKGRTYRKRVLYASEILAIRARTLRERKRTPKRATSGCAKPDSAGGAQASSIPVLG